MTLPIDPRPSRPSRPTASTIGLAVLLASLMVGVAIVGWFLSPASAAETEHLSGLCEGLMETQIDALTQALNATGEEQTRQVNRAWAAEKLIALEEC